MRTDAGAVEERHPELHPGMLSEAEQALPDTEAGPTDEGLIPILIDQNPCVHWRSPMDMMRQGWSMSLFQASQQ